MKEGEEQDNPALFDIIKESRGDLDLTLQIEKLEEKYNKERKRRQEVEGELSIVKTITIDSSPEMRDAKARIKELDNSLSIALEINEEHQRYNGKLQTRVTDLEEDNKKLAHQVEDLKMNGVRKAGL